MTYFLAEKEQERDYPPVDKSKALSYAYVELDMPWKEVFVVEQLVFDCEMLFQRCFRYLFSNVHEVLIFTRRNKLDVVRIYLVSLDADSDGEFSISLVKQVLEGVDHFGHVIYIYNFKNGNQYKSKPTAVEDKLSDLKCLYDQG